MCKLCSKLTIKTPERRHPLTGKIIVKEIQITCTVIFSFNEWRRSDVFIVKFGHISHIALMFLLLTLNKYIDLDPAP